jgi:hypothetical protein
MSEIEFALEQAEIVVTDRNYDEWSRAALVAATIASANGKKKYKVSDFIGEAPHKQREKRKKQNRIDTVDKDTLRQIALNKGLDVSF